VRHHDRGGGVESSHQQPALLVHRETRRATHHGEAARGEPRRRRIEERFGDARIALGLEESEEPGSVMVLGEVCVVLDRRNPTDDPPLLVAGEEQLDLTVTVERMLGVEQICYIASQGRDPEGVTAIQAKRQLDERTPIRAAAYRGDVDQWFLQTVSGRSQSLR
jgi:hypothetical protein